MKTCRIKLLTAAFCLLMCGTTMNSHGKLIKLNIKEASSIHGGIQDYKCPTVPNHKCGEGTDPCDEVMGPMDCFIVNYPFGVYQCTGSEVRTCRLWTNMRKECEEEDNSCCDFYDFNDESVCGSQASYHCSPNPHFSSGQNCNQCTVNNLDSKCVGDCK